MYMYKCTCVKFYGLNRAPTQQINDEQAESKCIYMYTNIILQAQSRTHSTSDEQAESKCTCTNVHVYQQKFYRLNHAPTQQVMSRQRANVHVYQQIFYRLNRAPTQQVMSRQRANVHVQMYMYKCTCVPTEILQAQSRTHSTN